MFFYASKIISALIWPSTVITLLLLAGATLVLAGRWLIWGRRMLASGMALLLACGIGPIGNLMVLPLEQRFARETLPGEIAGVILLGGFESGEIVKARGQLSLNESAERLTEGVLVALSRPKARVVFTGGDGAMFGGAGSAAGSVGHFLEAVGISRERIVLEEASRTTYENAAFLVPLLKPQAGERWVLVTSAFHMPRSVATFRKQGFDVIPWPADYRTRGTADALTTFANVTGGLERVDLAFKEWVGLVAYRLSGRSNAIWPSASASPAAANPAAAPLPGRRADEK